MRIRDIAALATLAVVLGGCASTTAPLGSLPGPTGAGEDPYGGWVTVEAWEGGRTREIEGELIAVTPDSLYLLDGSRLVALYRLHMVAATLNRYAPASAPMAGWAVFGSLSSLSHGYFIVASLPLWILVGSVSTNAVTNAAIVRSPPATLQSFAPYARFPAGLPPQPVHLEPRPFLRR